MIKIHPSTFFDVIKYPIITDKTTRLIEENQYSFAVDCKTNKYIIKQAIEYIFNVQVCSVNTMYMAIKKRKIRNIAGKKAQYKKAIVKLASKNTINLLST
uniref:Ribosomal protein L23 n=1 Tax=Apophlaea sinclairii TaxID=212746 RepID=A0A1C9CBX9_9FLOR|nr:ribosomal protein L23 [Apophlaea sinclairii]AOM65877.1 ribosomal protein L23 [Apophlaea sinclairii]